MLDQFRPHQRRCGPPREYVEIFVAEWSAPVSCYLLDDQVWEVELHYLHEINRTSPCPGKDACKFCLDGIGTRPTGYVAAAIFGSYRRGILQLSDAALTQYDMLFGAGETVRGTGVKTARASRKRSAKMLLTRHDPADAAHLPETFDVRPTLAWMFAVAEKRGLVGRTAGQIADDKAARRSKKRRKA